jgi:rubrerythrin
MEKKTILQSLDPDIVSRMVSRREAILKVGKLGIAAASAPVALGVIATDTFGQAGNLPQQIVDVLNFALTLEEREAEMYDMALDARNLIPRTDRKVFQRVGRNEKAHVRLLRVVLGGRAIPKPAFDHTGGGMFPDIFTNYQTFTAVSQMSEETGVRAYKGQATNLMSNDMILETALRIHSVEARHVSEIRRLRGQKGWITGNSRGNLPAAAQPTYDGEDNMMQGGADLSSLPGVPRTAISEAFDEPLTREEVLAIVRPFIRG